MLFSNIALSRRLEHAEGQACLQFAEARRRSFPDSGAEWMRCAGAYVVFDGPDSPVTQTFGLGLFKDLTLDALPEIERFLQERGARVQHEVSPFAGAAALDLLCARGYRPVEISSVLYQAVQEPVVALPSGITVRVIGPEEMPVWNEISLRGWTHEHPELVEFMSAMMGLASARTNSVLFLAELDGVPGAAGTLAVHEGVALFGGAATVPDLRRRGLQTALLEERMRYAAGAGYDLAMMVTEVGSESQRNAERKGFRIAYTRMKWKLFE
jgi:GNAT superfamily N-acetyltransferase